MILKVFSNYDSMIISTPDWQYVLDTYGLALNKVALTLVNSQVIGAMWTWSCYADTVSSRINSVSAELNTGAASLFQVLGLLETSCITSYGISSCNSKLLCNIGWTHLKIQISTDQQKVTGYFKIN